MDPRSSDPAWIYHQHGECVGCGTITGQDQDELCEDCYRLECEEDDTIDPLDTEPNREDWA